MKLRLENEKGRYIAFLLLFLPVLILCFIYLKYCQHKTYE